MYRIVIIKIEMKPQIQKKTTKKYLTNKKKKKKA